MALKEKYSQRYKEYLDPVSKNLQSFLIEILKDENRIDRISTRAKSVNRFLSKAKKIENGTLKYSDPINEIQDQIGARVITFYLDDVDNIATILKKYLAPIEEKRIVPDSVNEFGYEGKHFIFFIPTDVQVDASNEEAPKFFELQIKTLYQHAWSEANHDLGYKPEIALKNDEKRKLAFTAAQSWGADTIFNDLNQAIENSTN